MKDFNIENFKVNGIAVDLENLKYQYIARNVTIDDYNDHIGEADPVNNYGFEFHDDSNIVELYVESNQDAKAIHGFIVRFIFNVNMTEFSETHEGYFSTLEGYDDRYYDDFFKDYVYNVVPVLEVYVNQVKKTEWPLVMARGGMLPFSSNNDSLEYTYSYVGGILPNLELIKKSIQNGTLEYGKIVQAPVITEPVIEPFTGNNSTDKSLNY